MTEHLAMKYSLPTMTGSNKQNRKNLTKKKTKGERDITLGEYTHNTSYLKIPC